MKLDTKACKFELKELTDKGTFTGYASVFGVMDDGADVVERGAFAQTLSDKGTKGRKVPMLWAHDSRQPIGLYDELKEDDHGLWCAGRFILEVPKAVETNALMKAGVIDGLSIGFRTKVSEYDTAMGVRKLKQVDLYEISCVTFPMLDVARVEAVKGLPDDFDPRALERELKGLGLSNSDAVKAVAAVKKHLTRDGSDASTIPARDEKGLTELLASLRQVRAEL